MNQQKHQRRQRALSRLENQLKKGKKTVKGSFTDQVELSDKDIKRINKEIQILRL